VIHRNLIYLCSLLIDIDECTSPEANECNPNAVCNNTEGTYTCRCQNGYEGDGKSCAGNVVVVVVIFFLMSFTGNVIHLGIVIPG